MPTPQIKTKRDNIVDEMHGIKIADPYRWLEDSDSAEVKDWIKNQNRLVDESLKDDIFNIFSDELAKNFKTTTFSNPVPVDGRYFYVERQPDEDQNVLYVKKGLDGKPMKIYDPNGKREGNTVTIDYWSPSHTGKYVAYGISEGGDEMATIFVKDVDTGQQLPDKILRCRHSEVRWLPDDLGFFYIRNPRPGAVRKNEEHLHAKVYFHKLGDDPDNDTLIFGEGRPKDDMIGLRISPLGRYVGIKAARTWTENDVYIYDCKLKETKPLVIGIKARFSGILLKDKVLLYTNYKANNYRVLSSTYENMYQQIDKWTEFIPERKSLLESVRVTKSKIFAEYLVDACSKVVEFDYDGREVGKISLPKYSNLAGMSTRIEEEEFFYGVDSFIFPKIVYRHDPALKKNVEYRKTDNPIVPNDYEVKQEWYESKDETRVPIFIFHKEGVQLDGKNPTILYGYGGFNNSETPSFMRSWVPWIERGGIFAIANIRGGGEFGDAWHKGGIMEHKQNTFDDFIAGAEHLVSRKYCDKQHLGIIGGSNGGLLVSAVGVQRPDLFKAICSRVPLTDMVRFPKFGIAIRWIHEYGDPEVKVDLENILTWSPYHNVKAGTKYPDFLFTTANKDTRVDPLHSRKMAAAIGWANKSNTALIFTEMEAGHGSGKPIIKIVEGQALILTFFAKRLGLKV